MAIYRLNILHHGKRLGHFESDTPHSAQAVQTLLALLQAQDGAESGFEFSLQVAYAERRVLETDPQGMRVLAREPLFQSCALEKLGV